ncbi:MAG: hypothetical protein K9L28_04630 [Synergistales bacterium]|nr:hypothetical protein [Synergistales bacterium]
MQSSIARKAVGRVLCIPVAFPTIGAVTTAFLFPILFQDMGTRNLLYILIDTSLLGAVVAWRFGIEAKGKNLEELE